MADEKAIGIWLRVSTEDQVKGESPEHHEKRARAYAEFKGWSVVEVYRLDAISGKSVMQHAEAVRMLADVRSGRISGLVFSKLARLARNTRELLDFAEIFRQCGADLISLQEQIDTSTPAGRLFFTMIAALAQWEREEIADRVAASVPVRAGLGKPLGGKAPFGYQWKDKRLVPEPSEASVRSLVYELYQEHGRKKAVAQILNDRGYRTRSGRTFSAMSIEDLIVDPTPKGLHRSNYTTRRRGGAYEVKPPSEWVLTPVEAIVAPELWENCNRILRSRKTGEPFPGPRPEHLFGGKVRCQCGGKMYARKQTGKYTCSACNLKIPADDLETIYHSQLSGFLFSDAEIETHLRGMDETLASKVALIERQTDEARKVTQEIDRLFELHAAGQLATDSFGARHRPLDQRLTQLNDEIARLQATVDVAKMARINQSYMLDEARTLHARWPELPREDRRAIVQAITDEIVIAADSIDIRLQYQPEAGISVGKDRYEEGSPEGWLCTRITALAESSSARRTTSRG